MFEERNLLYFEEYYFENGNPAKPKYFLVLKADSNGMMLISLPSSKDYIPASIEKSFTFNHKSVVEVSIA